MAKKFSTFAPKTRAALLVVLIFSLLLAILAAASCKNSGGPFGKGARASAGAAMGGEAGNGGGVAGDELAGADGGLRQLPGPAVERFVSIEKAIAEIEASEAPSQVDAEVFDTLRDELVRQIRERAADYGGRIPAAAPVGDSGRVTDLAYDPETNMLTWSYVNMGDYDLSGDVGVPDITPIALNYGKLVSYDLDGKPSGDIGTPEGLVNHRLAWIDGDGNGEIGISDITPIALNYLNEVNRYLMVTSEEAEGQFNIIGQPVPLVAEMTFPVNFEVELPAGMLAYGAVVAFNATDLSIGDKSNIVQTGAPEPPTGLTIQAGNKRAVIGWEPSGSTGITGYNLYYGLSADKAGLVLLTEEPLSPDAIDYLAITSPETPISNGVRYYFWVSATRGATESAQAGPISVVPFNIPPSASFTTVPDLPYTGSVGDAITFNSTSTDSDGVIVKYIWDFDGDGTADQSGTALVSIQHTYTEAGMFEPRLTVMDDDGAARSYSGGSVSIGVGIPVAVASAEPSSGNPPLTVYFSAAGSYDPDGNIVEYAWKFFGADYFRDYTSEGGAASYEYTEPGIYLATLRVLDNDGKSAVSSIDIVVNVVPNWHTEVVDRDGNVGWDTSIAIDSTDNPHISYNDATLNALKYARRLAEEWNIQTIDAYGGGNHWGTTTSIALDHNDYPHISFIDIKNYDLKYSKWNGAKWITETIDSIGNVGYWSCIALNSNGNPHISYWDHTNFDLKYASMNGLIWDIETVESEGSIGRWTSIALDTFGIPYISYWDASAGADNGVLRVAKKFDTQWECVNADEEYGGGECTSIILDTNNSPHVSYSDRINGNLKYSYWNGTLWISSTVDSNGDVGRYTSIALNSNGFPGISYYDVSNANLKYAQWGGSSWNIYIVDDSADVGMYSSLAFDSGNNAHISYYDNEDGDLKYAWYE